MSLIRVGHLHVEESVQPEQRDLDQRVGDATVPDGITDQLRHHQAHVVHENVQLPRGQHFVTIQVLPYTSIEKLALCGPFAGFSFGSEPHIETVTVNNLSSTSVLEGTDDLTAYAMAFDELRSAAQSPDESIALIRRTLELMQGKES